MDDRTPAGTPGDDSARIGQELLRRLAELEEEATSLRWGFRVLGVAFLAAVALIGLMLFQPDLLPTALQVQPTSGEVRTEAVVLMDADGLERGRWAVDEGGNTRLAMFDERGRPRLRLSVLEGGFPGMSLINGEGQARAALGLLQDETTSLVFADAAGVPRAVLGLTRDDGANLVFANAQGVSQVGIGVDGSGVGSAFLPEPSDEGSDGGEGG